MSCDAHLFDCQWPSERNPERFKNLRESVSIVHTDAKTKLKALELFKLQKRKRQRSYGSEPTQSKPCNPASHLPTTQGVATYNACITGETSRLKGQAMPDFPVENVANVPYEFETACGMSPEPGAQTWKTHTIQPMGQDGWPLTILKPNIARCTKNHTETKLHGPHSESQLIIHHGDTNLVTRYPAPHIKPPTTWTPNERNPKTLRFLHHPDLITYRPASAQHINSHTRIHQRKPGRSPVSGIKHCYHVIFLTVLSTPPRIFQYLGGYIVLKSILVLSTPQKKQYVTGIAFFGG